MVSTEPRPESEPPLPRDERRRPASVLPWILLAVVVLIVAWYFLGRRDAATPPAEPATPIGDATPVPSDSPVSTDPAPRERSTTPTRPVAATPARREARAVDQPAPEYPASALRSGTEGTVTVRVEVDASGRPGNVEVVRSSRSRDLDQAALRAVRGWTFQPAMENGSAVASTVEVPVDFRVEQR